LFAVGAGLVALLASCGVRPDAVAGHSVGEITAAYAAGVLSLADACALVAARARLMRELPGGGAMYAVAASEAEMTAALDGVAGVAIAAVNGPAAVVISGEAGAVRGVAETFAARGRRVRRLRVSHAFHSPRMDPVLGPLGRAAAGLAHTPPRVPWACALTGELVDGCDPGYWVRQAREPVRFADALATLASRGVNVFIEIGPDGTLSALGPGALPAANGGEGSGAVFIPLLRPGQPGPATVVAALARAHVRGVGVDWAAVLGGGQRVGLPTYAFQQQRFWPRPAPAAAAGGDGAGSVAEARFWAAVEGGDLPALAGTLAVEACQPFSDVLPALATWRRREHDRSRAAAWQYRTIWSPLSDPAPPALAGTWLLVTPAAAQDTDLAQDCARALAAHGAHVIRTQASAATPDRAALAAQITAALASLSGAGNGTGPQAAGDAAGAGAVLAGVVSLLAVDEAPAAGHPVVPGGLAATLALVQALGDAGITAPLWC
jgi:acyl transferase domain-containing protein